MKVFAYLRVSTAEQLSGGGHDRQEQNIREFCDRKGWKIARVFKDQQSGADPMENRRMLMDMLALSGPDSATGVSIIVVESSTRLSRELMHQEIFLDRCRKNRVEVYGADSEQELALREADPTRVLIRQLLGALSQWERSVINERLLAGRRKKTRETGKPCGGPQPYGQTAAERAIIHEIFHTRQCGKAFLRIASDLQAQGYPSPDGRAYWPASTVHRLYNREVNQRAAVNMALQDGDQ